MNRYSLIALALIVLPSAASCQTVPDQKAFCFRGHPFAECRHFSLLELTIDDRVATTHAAHDFRSGPPENGSATATLGVGWMTNHPDNTATGGAIEIGGTDLNTRFALEARRRHWVNRWLASDYSLGVVALRTNEDHPQFFDHYGVGLAGRAGWSLGDLLTFTAGVDLIQSRHTQLSLTAGGRFGSWATVGLVSAMTLLVAGYNDPS